MEPKKIISYFLEHKQVTMILFSLLVALVFFTIFAFNARKYPSVETPGPREKIIVNFDVLNKAGFQELEIFEGSGFPDERGRPNPFIMYRSDTEPSLPDGTEG